MAVKSITAANHRAAVLNAWCHECMLMVDANLGST